MASSYGYGDLIALGDDYVSQSVTGAEVVEPLDSPITVQDLMRRFPEPIYQQGTDSHLYHFMQALCGESGAGSIAKLSYYARLPQEVSLLEYSDLDTFYTSHFNFKRLKSEVYDASYADYNTEDVWRDMQRKDRSYNARLIHYLQGVQLGTTATGLAMVAAAAIGHDVEVVENYRFVYDHYTDDPLGIEQVGRSTSVNEFTLVPHLQLSDGTFVTDINGDDITYESDFRRTPPDVNTPIPDPSVRATLPAPVKQSLYAELSQLSGVSSFETDGEFHHLLPELEYNMTQLVDRTRPVGAHMSLDPQRSRYRRIQPRSISASSERFEVTRLVTGRSGVKWPAVDAARGYFIEEGVENAAPNAENARQWPSIFLNIETAIAYSSLAEADLSYGTSDFYGTSTTSQTRQLVWSDDPPPLAQYISSLAGAPSPRQAALLPVLNSTGSHSPAQALAARNTLLQFVSRPRF